MDFEISHEETGSKGRFYINDGQEDIGELTYSKAGDDRIIIDHTQVSESHRGEDLGKKMVFKAADHARQKKPEGRPALSFC